LKKSDDRGIKAIKYIILKFYLIIFDYLEAGQSREVGKVLFPYLKF